MDGIFVPASPEEMALVRKQLGTDEEDIKRAIGKLREWLEMQPHLPDKIDDDRIERMYINCKCSMERLKLGVDALFSLKTRLPDMLMNRDPLGADVLHTKQHVKLMTMPRLTKEGYRVHIITGIDPDASTLVLPTYGKLLSMAAELLHADDYSLGDVSILDLADVNAGHILRADINVFRNLELFYKTAYCRRQKGFHLVNAPKIIDPILRIVKGALSTKLQKRVFVHLSGSKTLFDHIPRDYIPDELGGTAGPVDKFSYQLLSKADAMRDWFLEQDQYISDESKRPVENRYAEDIYGVAGSFKKLSVD